MRGLDTRVLLAKTRILFLVDAAAANKQMDTVRSLAEADGWNDAANGFNTVPTMFADEPNLAHNWAEGHHRYNNFDENAWRRECAESADAANTCCGLSYEAFVRRLNGYIDGALEELPPTQRAEATKIAQSFGYETVEERAHAMEAVEEWGSDYDPRYCIHDIKWGCCPAGCGSGPDD
jgi:hypothetical protein